MHLWYVHLFLPRGDSQSSGPPDQQTGVTRSGWGLRQDPETAATFYFKAKSIIFVKWGSGRIFFCRLFGYVHRFIRYSMPNPLN